jgi:hypothetical protein
MTVQTHTDTPPVQVAAPLAALAAGRQAPPGPQQVALLLDAALPGSPPEVLLPALALLARWARQQAMQPATARDSAMLRRSLAAAQHLLAAPAAQQPRVTAACLLLLGGVAAADAGQEWVDAATEAAGSVLLGGQLGAPEPSAASDAMAAVGSLLPCLLVSCGWMLYSYSNRQRAAAMRQL